MFASKEEYHFNSIMVDWVGQNWPTKIPGQSGLKQPALILVRSTKASHWELHQPGRPKSTVSKHCSNIADITRYYEANSSLNVPPVIDNINILALNDLISPFLSGTYEGFSNVDSGLDSGVGGGLQVLYEDEYAKLALLWLSPLMFLENHNNESHQSPWNIEVLV